MPLSNEDPFSPYLKEFLDKNYEADLRGPGDLKHPDAVPPLKFLDRHIASNLTLKRVKSAPWLPSMLGRLCDESIDDFLHEGHSFSVHGYPTQTSRYQSLLRNSKKVFGYYCHRVGDQCLAYASKLIFHPNDSKWFSFLRSHISTSMDNYEAFRQEAGICVIDPKETETGEMDFDIPRAVRKILPNWALPTLFKLDRRESLANWECFIMTKQAETLLQRMGPIPVFKWEMPGGKGYPTLIPPPRPLDSSCTHLFLPSSSGDSKPSRSKTKLKGPESSGNTQPTAKAGLKRNRNFTAPTRLAQVRNRPYRPDVTHFLQAAWSRAVGDDVTFIIFNCGRYERIGVRHRETQTLYLSDLIDPASCKNPAYSKMHLGLTIAILKDCLDRLQNDDTEGDSPHVQSKRPLAKGHSINSRKGKAGKRKASTKDSKEIFDNELSKRELALLHLNFDIFRSPVPSSFLRIGPSCIPRLFQDSYVPVKRTPQYTPQKYLAMTANAECIGQGATGLVHRVVVDLELESGAKQQRNLILKLAFWDESKERMVQEYEVYKKLASAGVTQGLVAVHGLFQDMETGMLAMIMDDAGKTLRQRALEEYPDNDSDDGVEITEAERDAFIRALSGIHKAHVLHDDIRLDNLMINEDSQVFIIDFDRGNLNPDPDSYESEMYELRRLIVSADEEESE